MSIGKASTRELLVCPISEEDRGGGIPDALVSVSGVVETSGFSLMSVSS